MDKPAKPPRRTVTIDDEDLGQRPPRPSSSPALPRFDSDPVDEGRMKAATDAMSVQYGALREDRPTSMPAPTPSTVTPAAPPEPGFDFERLAALVEQAVATGGTGATSPTGTFRIDPPKYLCDALDEAKAKLKRRGIVVTKNFFVVLGLQAIGFDVLPQDLVPDGRKGRGDRRKG